MKLDELQQEIQHLIGVMRKFKAHLDDIIANDTSIRFLTLTQVCKRLGISRATLLRDIKEGARYPKPLPRKAQRSTLYWDVKEIVRFENNVKKNKVKMTLNRKSKKA